MMIWILLSVVVFVGLFFFFFKKKDADQKKQSTKAMGIDLHSCLEHHVLFYQKLDAQNQIKFRTKAINFLEETSIEAVQFELEDLDKVLVAASAVIPVFYFEFWEYHNLSSVIIYPDYFNKDLCFKGENRNIAGLVSTGKFENQMILSRKALHHGFSNQSDKNNTAIHEFVHLIDKADGKIDGIPKVLLAQNYVLPWLGLIHQKMEEINRNKSDIRAYGGTSQIEFFAVAAEYFFERPKLLKRKHPDLYHMMENCFGRLE